MNLKSLLICFLSLLTVHVAHAEMSYPGEVSPPGEPWVPAEPSTPGEPWTPAEPAAPGEPSVPGDPWSPGEPSIPGEPSAPSEPAAPPSPSAMAEQPWHENPDPGLTVTVTELLVLRPAGLIGTIVGTAFFVAFSPLTALASIPPPHDAFEKTADVFIVTPARYTFERPFGAVAYDPSHY